MYGETPPDRPGEASSGGQTQVLPAEFDLGFLVGVLVGEGHFGGDGRQPQITLRMHTRHERLFQWLQRVFPGGKLYGPYHHGGRSYYQWMVRGEYLRTVIAPLIAGRVGDLDGYAEARFAAMCRDYGVPLSSSGSLQPPAGPPSI